MHENVTNVQRMYSEFPINFSEISEQFIKFCRNDWNTQLIFLCISFSKILWTFPKNPAEIFKTSFKLYSPNFYINTLIGWNNSKWTSNINKHVVLNKRINCTKNDKILKKLMQLSYTFIRDNLSWSLIQYHLKKIFKCIF